MIISKPKKFAIFISFFCSLNAMQEVEQLRERISDEAIHSSNISLQIDSQEIPPLDVLLEHQRLLWVKALALKMKKGIYPNKGLLLTGPAGTGKFSIAANIAAISKNNFISVEARDFAQGKLVSYDREAFLKLIKKLRSEVNLDNSENDEIKLNDSALKKLYNLFNKLKNYSHLVLFINNIEYWINNNPHFLKFFSQYYNQFKKSVGNTILLIGSTRNDDISKNLQISTIFKPIAIETPKANLREKIIEYYRIKNDMRKDRENTAHPDIKYDIVLFGAANATEYLSGADIKEVIESVEACMLEGADVSVDSKWFKYSSEILTTNHKRNLIAGITGFPLILYTIILPDKFEPSETNYFYAICEETLKMKDVSTNFSSLAIKFAKLSHNALSNLNEPLMFILNLSNNNAIGNFVNLFIAPIGEAVFSEVSDNLREVASERVENYAETFEVYKNAKKSRRLKKQHKKEEKARLEFLKNMQEGSAEIARDLGKLSAEKQAKKNFPFYKELKDNEKIEKSEQE